MAKSSYAEIVVEPREITGRKARRALSEKGMIPGIVYGGGKPSVSIAVDPKMIIQILRSDRGRNSILLFSLKGTKAQRHVMVKDLQIDPLTSTLIHADFTRIMMDQKVKVNVPVVFEGVPFGVKTEGGITDVITREVEVECLPDNIPDSFAIDITPLKVGDSVKIADLELDENVKLLEEDLSQPLILVAAPRIEAEPVAEEGEELEGEEEPQIAGKEESGEEARPEDEEKGGKE